MKKCQNYPDPLIFFKWPKRFKITRTQNNADPTVKRFFNQAYHPKDSLESEQQTSSKTEEDFPNCFCLFPAVLYLSELNCPQSLILSNNTPNWAVSSSSWRLRCLAAKSSNTIFSFWIVLLFIRERKLFPCDSRRRIFLNAVIFIFYRLCPSLRFPSENTNFSTWK